MPRPAPGMLSAKVPPGASGSRSGRPVTCIQQDEAYWTNRDEAQAARGPKAPNGVSWVTTSDGIALRPFRRPFAGAVGVVSGTADQQEVRSADQGRPART